MDYRTFIEEGQPVAGPRCKGTPFTVEYVLSELGRGTAERDLLRRHPQLRPEHIRAAMLRAAAGLTRKAA